ncbi:MAG: hypothetical protein WC422_03465 [Candidatus Paceibacterota bacterium]|jgi:hypothetical protein
MAQFVFLYPVPQIIDFEINRHASWSGKVFKKKYKKILNQCIDQRYRQKGFDINYVIFNDCVISNIIRVYSNDKIIKAGIDFRQHILMNLYPDQDYILNQLNEESIIRIAGYHMWDCVDKLAKRAYQRKMDVLVDEDLTEFLSTRLDDKDFRTDQYPTYRPGKQNELLLSSFMEARKQRPWLWQNY